MKKLIFKILFFTLVVFVPVSAFAGVSVHIDIPLPPPIFFPAPPGLVVIPETDVYSVPDVDAEIFFYGGWWWRPWQGRWYRSHYYDRSWAYYPRSPHFYRSVPRGWRDDYRNNRWRGNRWEHQRIPSGEIQRNWSGWQRDRHWQRQGWGVQGMQRPQKQYRQERRPARPQPGFRGEMRPREERGR